MSLATGPYSICRVESPDGTDGLIFITLSWGYETEDEAIADVKRIALQQEVPLDDIVVIKEVFAMDLEAEGRLPEPPPPPTCKACGSVNVCLYIEPILTAGPDHGTLVQYIQCQSCGDRREYQRI